MEKVDSDGCSASTAKKIFKRLRAKPLTPISSATVDDEFYPLNEEKMGTCLIFNHKIFDCGAKKRNGTDKDKDALELFFHQCGFDVQVHTDKKADEITDILQDAVDKVHKNDCCFVCCVLTHGDLKYKLNTEVLFARDKYYNTEKLFSPFYNCHTLLGKPKMFFIQACRGGKLTGGMDILFKESAGSKIMQHKVQVGNETFLMCTIPKEADFLIAHSTVPGSLAWKISDCGSWFIQELCKALNEKSEDSDLESILTIVRREVAINYEGYIKSKGVYYLVKQIPSLYTTLTRKFKFPSLESNCPSKES